MRGLWPLLLMSFLSACAAKGSECSLLTLREYPGIVSDRLADEIEAAPPGTVWPGVVADYVALRDEVRACRG